METNLGSLVGGGECLEARDGEKCPMELMEKEEGTWT